MSAMVVSQSTSGIGGQIPFRMRASHSASSGSAPRIARSVMLMSESVQRRRMASSSAASPAAAASPPVRAHARAGFVRRRNIEASTPASHTCNSR